MKQLFPNYEGPGEEVAEDTSTVVEDATADMGAAFTEVVDEEDRVGLDGHGLCKVLGGAREQRRGARGANALLGGLLEREVAQRVERETRGAAEAAMGEGEDTRCQRGVARCGCVGAKRTQCSPQASRASVEARASRPVPPARADAPRRARCRER